MKNNAPSGWIDTASIEGENLRDESGASACSNHAVVADGTIHGLYEAGSGIGIACFNIDGIQSVP